MLLYLPHEVATCTRGRDIRPPLADTFVAKLNVLPASFNFGLQDGIDTVVFDDIGKERGPSYRHYSGEVSQLIISGSVARRLSTIRLCQASPSSLSSV